MTLRTNGKVINMTVTAERLRHLLRYEPSSGLFFWKHANSPRIKVGDLAGSETQGYINIQIDGKLYRAHRLAWLYNTGAWPALNLDHVNGISTDNSMENLREANQSENTANARGKAKSGFKGVTAYRGRWVASIRKNGMREHLGVFDTPEEAHCAYVDAAQRLHGEFARAA